MREKGVEKSYLRVTKLNQITVIRDDLPSLIIRVLEQLLQRKPLRRHLIPIIRIHKLVIVDTVGGVAFHALDGGFAAVEVDDVLHEALTGGREGQGF